ncbi:MAG: hypothetical protein NT169_25555 [Chloroflexi bacterium]|nr:hypothetical protein [Chloroflexota bacterium]
MFRRSLILMATALVVGMVGLAGAGAAFAAAGTGPDSAATLPGNWVKLDAGSRVWYAFQYGGDGSQISARVASEPAGAVAFSVWTPGGLALWSATGEEKPVGRGSANNTLGGDWFWTGHFNEAGTYYLVVESTGNIPAYYMPQISGDAVYVAPATVAEVATAAPAASAAPIAAAVAAPQPAKSGTGPADALTPSANWTPLAAGQWAWYAFQYAGDGSQVMVRMAVDPASPVTFSVWTPADVAQWAQDGTMNPVGRGSASKVYGDDLIWTGHFNTPGTYYVVVENANATPSNYLLTIN